jgi:hypothetical protein
VTTEPKLARCPVCDRGVYVRGNGTLHLHQAEVTRPGHAGTIKVACDGSNRKVRP